MVGVGLLRDPPRAAQARGGWGGTTLDTEIFGGLVSLPPVRSGKSSEHLSPFCLIQIKISIPLLPKVQPVPGRIRAPPAPCPVLPARFRLGSAQQCPPAPQLSILASLGGICPSPTPLLPSPKGGHGIVSLCFFSSPPQTLRSLPAPPQPPRVQATKVKSGGLQRGYRLVPRIPFLKETVQAGGAAEGWESKKEPCLGGHTRGG